MKFIYLFIFKLNFLMVCSVQTKPDECACFGWFGLFIFYCFNFVRQWLESLQHFNILIYKLIAIKFFWGHGCCCCLLLNTTTHIITYMSLWLWMLFFLIRLFVSGKHWECHLPYDFCITLSFTSLLASLHQRSFIFGI